MSSLFSRLVHRARWYPFEAALLLGSLLVTVYVLATPLMASTYPPMTDLPFHAAQSAAIRHYFDPAWHVRDQFELHPLATPYMSFYATNAFLMLIFSPLTATKITVFLLLALVPAGVAVLCHGMKKSPLIALMSLGVCWGNLTQWGFINYVSALGLFAMVVGLTLMLLDRPSRARQIALTLALVALFFGHIFRFPFAIAAVLGSAVVMYPATRRFRPILAPLGVALSLFVIWWAIKPEGMSTTLGPLELHRERFTKEFVDAIAKGFKTPEVTDAIKLGLEIGVGIAIISAIARIWIRVQQRRCPRAWEIGVTVIPLACAAVFLTLFLTLPERIGSWWYVYPREAMATLVVLFSLCPDLPRTFWLRAGAVVALCASGVHVARLVATEYAPFDHTTRDFDAVVEKIPAAPKLLYVVFEHTGTHRTFSPVVHFPAWVQATKGGWLSWHFAEFGASPLALRRNQPGAVVAPEFPSYWEWSPNLFRSPVLFARVTPFFDWFLIRDTADPSSLFKADPSIAQVAHQGTWWLFQRRQP